MKRFAALAVLAALLACCAARSAETEPSGADGLAGPVSPAEARMFPPRAVEGDPPANGLRHWSPPLVPLPVHGCYVSWIQRGSAEAPTWEMWQNTWGADASERNLRVLRGPAFDKLGAPVTACTGEIIDDVFTPAAPRSLKPKEPKELSPLRGFTRPHVIYGPKIGYVALTCVCPDYKPGSVSLMPALLTSPDGQAGSWTYRGMLKGDPLEEQEKLGRPLWSDGGSVVPMPDGTWRIYVNNFGKAAIALLTAETLDGPWRFLRNEDGSIRDLLPPGSNGKRRPNCFPFVLRVEDNEWHLWYSDGWPCQSVWHFASRDGVEWAPYGKQPEITRAAVNGHGIKCLRVCLDPDGKTLHGFLSVWSDSETPGEKGWRLYRLTLPAGLPDNFDPPEPDAP